MRKLLLTMMLSVAAVAYADGYEIGQQKYSYRETWFGEPAMYIDSQAVTSALVAIAG